MRGIARLLRRSAEAAIVPSGLTCRTRILRIRTAAEELHHIGDNSELGTFAAAIAVFPLFQVQPPFHQYRRPFLQELRTVLRRPVPGGYIDKCRFVIVASGLIPPAAVGRQPEFADRGAVGSGAQIRIPGQIARQNYFVE